jgi:serine protease 16
MRLPNLAGNITNFNQTLDHFNSTSTETFQQRYVLNDDYCKPNCDTSSPILLYISGEAQMSESRIESGPLIDLAKATESLLASLEHRFYGRSIPRELTTENLARYLTTPQALADLAAFVTFLKNGNSSRAVIVAGGSYAGTLATYFRETYPHLANFSWSSSPPLHIKNDFTEYDQHVAEVLKSQSRECYNGAVKIVEYFDNRTATDAGFQEVRERMGFKNLTDKVSLLEIVADQFAGMVQYRSRDGGAELKEFCENQTHPEAIDDFFNWFNATNPNPDDDDVLQLTDVSNVSEQADSRAWTWQTCNEYGWFQTASGQLRSKSVNLSYFERVCDRLFNETIAVQDDLRRRFGDRKPNISNVVFVNGAIDPWSTLSLPSEANISSYNFFSVRIENGSHCSDLSPSVNDTQDIVKKREYVLDLLTQMFKNSTSCASNLTKCASNNQAINGRCELGHLICDEMWGGDCCSERLVDTVIFQVSAAALVVLPAIMMIVIGSSAWFLFQKEVNEPDIGAIRTLGE